MTDCAERRNTSARRETTRRQASGLWTFAAVILLVAACQTRTHGVPALNWETFGRSLERFRGQSVRVCGRLTRIGAHWAVEHVPRADEIFRHGNPAVFVVPCGTAAPRKDRDGCLAGRIAAQDGSLEPPPQQVRDNSPVSPDWFLHALCPARRG